MSKKAQGMPMNVIIIAVLALLVLVILAVIFIGRMGGTARNIDQCKGNCVSSEPDCTNQGPYFKVSSDPCYKLGTSNLGTDRPICCVGV